MVQIINHFHFFKQFPLPLSFRELCKTNYFQTASENGGGGWSNIRHRELLWSTKSRGSQDIRKMVCPSPPPPPPPPPPPSPSARQCVCESAEGQKKKEYVEHCVSVCTPSPPLLSCSPSSSTTPPPRAKGQLGQESMEYVEQCDHSTVSEGEPTGLEY